MSSIRHSTKRAALLRQLDRLGRRMLFGTASETYRTCGQPTCQCHHGGPKHGPHLQVSYRGETGKTTGYHVPAALADTVCDGVRAWQRFQEVARTLAALNREHAWRRHAKRSAR
ncbi:MAG: hypothetical protein HYS05_20405 [Acidobacteria bacterium]|nr:hypothetical protein [Acidobacteriota bacterium]